MTRLLPFLVLSASLAGALSGQTIFIASGNGQLVNSASYQTTEPLVVQVNDANGNPLPGVNIAWAVTAGQGNIPAPTFVTDAKGQASTDYTSATLNSDESFADTTVTATSKYGSVNFTVITVLFQFGTPPPTIQLFAPATLTAEPGSTLPGAVEVKVFAGTGAEQNAPIPNVGVNLVDGLTLMASPNAHCNGGTVYTDHTGTATCDVVVTGKPGLYSLRANVGEVQNTAAFELQINPGPTCTFSIAPTSDPVPALGGVGNVKVTAPTGCGWAATSNVPWITITSGLSGSGNGTVSFSVGADAGGARSGTLTIAGQTFTVNQGSGSSGALTITTPANLPGGIVNQSYSATLAASGGIPPYIWSVTAGALPAGLTLNALTGLISGAVTAAGTTSFTATVQDNAGTMVSLIFSVTITTSSSSFLITNPSFPNGIVDVPYNQALTFAGGIFDAFFQDPLFSISGGALPAGLGIVRNPDLSSSIKGTPTAVGVSSFTLSATDAATNTTAANFTITITGTPTAEVMSVSPKLLAFTVDLGSSIVPAAQPLSITGNGGVLAYTTVIATSSGGAWLVAQGSANGNTPGTVNIGLANYSNLAPGPYMGTVTISSVASDSPVVVPVTLTVVAAPSLAVSPATITVSQGMSNGSNVNQQSIQVSIASGSNDVASLGFSATATTKSGGNWLSVSPASGTTPATLTVSIDSGGLTIGAYSGSVTITPIAGPAQMVSVTLNVTNPQTLSVNPIALKFTSPSGAPSPAAQSVTVSASAGPALSLTTAVATTDKGNWLLVNPTGGPTPLDLSVTVDPSGLNPKIYQGTITVTASDDSVTPVVIPVTLTVTSPGPAISAAVNGASFATGSVAPGEIVTIFGSGLGPTTGVPWTASGPVGRMLDGTQVFFDSFSAPILYTSAGQVSAIVPYQLATASTTKLTVWYQGIGSAGDDLNVSDSAPGIFTISQSGQGAITNQDGTVNSPSNAAAIGSTVSIYATGEGQTNPPGVTGAINGASLPLPEPQLTVTAQVGGVPATVTYAGGSPNEVAGLLQVNVTIPAGVATGASVPVVITVGTAASQTGVTLAVKK
jgi:uncharacterized protein (TIGR03437 family)